MEGQRHKKKVASGENGANTRGTLRCDLCNVTVVGAPAMKAHINGMKHFKVGYTDK